LVNARCQYETPCRRNLILLIGDFVSAKLVEVTPCGHRSDKNRIYAAKELKQNLKHCKQLRKLYLQKEKVKKKMLQAINQIPL
jgi:hypothetical protein